MDLVSNELQDDNYGAEEVETLKTLVSNLRQLLELDQKYKCKLSLSVFEKVCSFFLTPHYSTKKCLNQCCKLSDFVTIFSVYSDSSRYGSPLQKSN